MHLSDILFYAALASGLMIVPVIIGLTSIRLDRADRIARLAARNRIA